MSADQQAEEEIYDSLRKGIAKLSPWPQQRERVIKRVIIDLMKLLQLQRIQRLHTEASFLHGVRVSARFYHCESDWAVEGVLCDGFLTPDNILDTKCLACGELSKNFSVTDSPVKEG